MKHGWNNNNYVKYYKMASYLIEKNGYISNAELLKIFHIPQNTNAITYFESQGNPIYDDHEIINGTRTLVFKLLNPVFEKWGKERHQNGKYNNSIYTSLTL